MNQRVDTVSQEGAATERLQDFNRNLHGLVTEARTRLEELEEIVSAISGGQVDAVVVERRGQPEVWTLEATDRMHLRMIQQAANVGTWNWEASTGEVACSETLLQIVGVPQETEPTLDAALGLLHPEDRTEVYARADSALADHDHYYDEFRIIRPDGSLRWLSARGRVVRGADGVAQRVIGIALDITERRLAEEAHKLADRRKDEFLAMLAHELRNPLAAISNAVRLSRTPELADKDRTWIQEMLDRQMELLGRLVDDLLDVARITRGRIELKREALSLTEVVNRAVETVRPQIDRANHRLIVQFAAEPLWIDADRTRLEQILVNLLSNAAKYTPERGELWLTVTRDSAGADRAPDGGRDEAVLTVRDTGIGIAGEMLPKVFDMFAQAEQGLARSQGGLGIGLTLVRRLVEMHGGQIAVESPGTGQGSTFTIRLPLAQPPAAAAAVQRKPPPAATAPPSPAQALRVLIVDDNRDAAQTLSRLLKLSGHQTEVAFDGPQALELAARWRPELALLDIGLPAMNGYELAGRLKQAHPGIYIAAISGYGQEADRQRAKEAGFDEHFLKPVKLESLLKLLEERQGAVFR